MGAGGVELELLAFTVGDTASQVFAVAQNAHLGPRERIGTMPPR